MERDKTFITKEEKDYNGKADNQTIDNGQYIKRENNLKESDYFSTNAKNEKTSKSNDNLIDLINGDKDNGQK
jgi:hypothetical protein